MFWKLDDCKILFAGVVPVPLIQVFSE
jgi:hypothetical protein